MEKTKVKDLIAGEFEAEVLKNELPVLVDFWAPWCGPCRMMAPILDELSLTLDGKIKVAKVDTENSANQNLAAEYQIQSIPNMKLFKQGKIIGEFIGMRDLDTLTKEIRDLI